MENKTGVDKFIDRILQENEIYVIISNAFENYSKNNNLDDVEMAKRLQISRLMYLGIKKGRIAIKFDELLVYSIRLTGSNTFFIQILEEIVQKMEGYNE